MLIFFFSGSVSTCKLRMKTGLDSLTSHLQTSSVALLSTPALITAAVDPVNCIRMCQGVSRLLGN